MLELLDSIIFLDLLGNGLMVEKRLLPQYVVNLQKLLIVEKLKYGEMENRKGLPYKLMNALKVLRN